MPFPISFLSILFLYKALKLFSHNLKSIHNRNSGNMSQHQIYFILVFCFDSFYEFLGISDIILKVEIAHCYEDMP